MYRTKLKLVLKYFVLLVLILLIAYGIFSFGHKVVRTDAIIAPFNKKEYAFNQTLKVIGGDRYFLLNRDNPKVDDILIEQGVFSADINEKLEHFEFEFFNDYAPEYRDNVEYAFNGLWFYKMEITSPDNPVLVQTLRRTTVFTEEYTYLREGTVFPSIDTSVVKAIVLGFSIEVIDEKNQVDKLVSYIKNKEDFSPYLKELGYDTDSYIDIYIEYENFPGKQHVAVINSDGILKYA